MRKFILILTLLLTTLVGFAQQLHFVYIQADNKQPFYVKTNNKLISSSASGYAIISKLQQGDYSFEIGFPKNEFPAQTISVPVNGDAGYALKNFGDKGWGLFNMQSLQTLMAGNAPAKTNSTASNNDFANVLADATNTPEIKNTTPKAQPVPVQEVQKPVPFVNTTGVTQLDNTTDATGRSLTYTSLNNGKKDTVIVFIPFDKNSRKPVAVKEAPANKQPEQVVQAESPVTSAVTNTNNGQGNEKFLDIEMQNPNSNQPVKTPIAPVKEVKTTVTTPIDVSGIPSFNSDCKNQASESDFFKLRKKMASENEADGMTSQAKKVFKTRCFTTEQVKNLGALYLDETSKYDFYQTAYPFVSDPRVFPSLQNELTSDYLINRFKALIHL